jgi:peptidoglycan hydrolase CwlO-like protein
MIAVAIDDWPAAAVSIAGIAFLTIVLSVALWQIFGTGKAAVIGHRDNEYRKVVDDLAAVQQETTAELQKANDALAQLRGQIAELEQTVKEVDRVLKTVD